MDSSNSKSKNRIITDSIHGAIALSEFESQVVDTASFQRLRHLKQLGLGHTTYPNATHTRFAHSLGVFAMMSSILSVARKPLQLDPETESDLKLAALLHDIGHYPYSHLFDSVDQTFPTEEQVDTPATKQAESIELAELDAYPDHEVLGHIIVTTQPDLLDALGGIERATRVANLFTKSEASDPQLSKLIHSSLDMDRLDYLVRDSHATGVPYGQVDIKYILHNLDVSESGMIGIKQKAITAAEQFLLARYFMYRAVYQHKTTFGFEESMRHLIVRCRSAGGYGIPSTGSEIVNLVVDSRKLQGFTDQYLDNLVRMAVNSEDPVIRGLAEAIAYRRPPKLLIEENALVDTLDTQSVRFNACTDLVAKCRERIQELSAKTRIPLGLFLICDPKPLRIEKRSDTVRAADAKNIPEEYSDELIKVFCEGDSEPRSLVDIPASLINVCARREFRIARLYVVENDAQKLEHLRTLISKW